MWDFSPPTRDQTRNPCIERQSLNPWITREVPVTKLLILIQVLDCGKESVVTEVIKVVLPQREYIKVKQLESSLHWG